MEKSLRRLTALSTWELKFVQLAEQMMTSLPKQEQFLVNCRVLEKQHSEQKY